MFSSMQVSAVRLDQPAEQSDLMIDSIPGLVAILAPSGEVTVTNTRLVEYCGRGLEELKQWGTNDTVHPEDLHLRLCVIWGGRELCEKLKAILGA